VNRNEEKLNQREKRINGGQGEEDQEKKLSKSRAQKRKERHWRREPERMGYEIVTKMNNKVDLRKLRYRVSSQRRKNGGIIS